jgi:hypothetical protein
MLTRMCSDGLIPAGVFLRELSMLSRIFLETGNSLFLHAASQWSALAALSVWI